MTAGASSISARSTVAAVAIGLAVVIAVKIGATVAPTPTRHSASISRPVPAAVRHARASNVLPAPVLALATPAAAASPAPFVIRRVLSIDGPIRYGSYFWDEAGVPAGPLTITVDLKAGVLSVFRDGYEIGTTAVIYGADHKPTPLGTFPILQKDRHHFSNLYHHAPMPYALRLTGDGVFIHASKIAVDYATHGCVGVPTQFAEKLFAVAKVGDRVIVTNQGMRADASQPQKIIG